MVKLEFSQINETQSQTKRNKKGNFSQKGSNKYDQLSEAEKPLTQRGRNKKNRVIDEKGILKDRKGRWNNRDNYNQVLKIRDHSVGSQREMRPAKGFDFNEDSIFDARNLLDHNTLNIGDRKID